MPADVIKSSESSQTDTELIQVDSNQSATILQHNPGWHASKVPNGEFKSCLNPFISPSSSSFFLLSPADSLLAFLLFPVSLSARCVASSSSLLPGCGSQSDWASACWPSFSSPCSPSRRGVKVSASSSRLRADEVDEADRGLKPSDLGPNVASRANTPQGRP